MTDKKNASPLVTSKEKTPPSSSIANPPPNLVSVERLPTEIAVNTSGGITYFSMTPCSEQEKAINEMWGSGVQTFGNLISLGLAFSGPGVAAAGLTNYATNTTAEAIRDQCRAEGSKQAGWSALKGAAAFGFNAVIPGSGIVKQVAEIGLNTASNSMIDEISIAKEPAPLITEPNPREPYPLIPTSKKLTPHQRENMQAASKLVHGLLVGPPVNVGNENSAQLGLPPTYQQDPAPKLSELY